MKAKFINIIGTDNKKYRVNVAQILYYYPDEKKGSLLTEIVFSNKESIETTETASEIDNRINSLLSENPEGNNKGF